MIFCHLCHEPKDEVDPHVCNEENKATVEFLRNNTKNCPKCGTHLIKINGCDQMFCIVPTCRTVFNWSSLKIDTTNRTHNPDYFRFLRENNINQEIRDDTNFQCFDMYDPQSRDYIYREFNKAFNTHIDTKVWAGIYQRCLHYFYLTNTLVSDVSNFDPEDIRIDYLLDKISEEEFEAKLQKKYKRVYHEVEIYNIHRMYLTVTNDIFLNLFHNVQSRKCTGQDTVSQNEFIKSINVISTYTNEQIEKINKRYDSRSMTFYIINPTLM